MSPLFKDILIKKDCKATCSEVFYINGKKVSMSEWEKYERRIGFSSVLLEKKLFGESCYE